MLLNFNYNTYVKHDMGLKIFLEGYPHDFGVIFLLSPNLID